MVVKYLKNWKPILVRKKIALTINLGKSSATSVCSLSLHQEETERVGEVCQCHYPMTHEDSMKMRVISGWFFHIFH